MSVEKHLKKFENQVQLARHQMLRWHWYWLLKYVPLMILKKATYAFDKRIQLMHSEVQISSHFIHYHGHGYNKAQ